MSAATLSSSPREFCDEIYALGLKADHTNAKAVVRFRADGTPDLCLPVLMSTRKQLYQEI